MATTLPASAPPIATARVALTARAAGVGAVLGWVGLHVAIGVGGALSPLVGTAHAALVILGGLVVVLGSPRVERVVAVTAYWAMCDVFWRMTEARAPWEASKYLLALGSVVIMVRFVRRWPHGLLPVAFLLLLVPGVLITFFEEGLSVGRDRVSGTEMGLLSFGLAALAFRHLVASRVDAWNLGWVLIGPLVAVLGVTSHALLANPDLEFSSTSNFDATGGFGPNQVSAALGLVMLLCALLAFLPWARTFWPLLGGLGVWSLWAAFLTFSRGGIYSTVIAGAAMLLVGISTRGARVRSTVTLVVGALALVLVFASANDFSGNWLDTRYEEEGTTGRTNIAELDLDVFGSHPLGGVGSGRASEFRGEGHLARQSAHTEFTRVLAEHGLLGLTSLALMGVMVVQGYRRSLCHWNRLMVVALAAWSLTTMLHAATRIGAISVMLALTQIRVEEAAPGGAAGRR